MIGKQQVVLDYSSWTRGMSSGSEIPDGGFSNETTAVNLTATPGIVYAPAAQVNADTDTILDDAIIASCPDMDAASPDDRLVMTNDGDFMTYNGTKLADVTNGQDSTRTYTKGFSDMVPWKGEIYFTSTTHLGRWTTPTTFDFTFNATANDGIWHPLLVFENNLYIGDGNLLERTIAAGTAPTTILTLGVNEFIVALGIDPGTGKMLISTTYGQNASGTLKKINKVLWYDGLSNKVDKSVIVEDQVTAFHSHQGRVYVGYGQNIGLLTGSGIQFLRKLTHVTLAQVDLPYKHNFASIGETMYVVDGEFILAFGSIRAGGPPVWRNFFENLNNTNSFEAIMNAGNNKLGYSFDASTPNVFRTIDTTSIANTDDFDFYTNWVSFPRPVQIRSFAIHYNEAIVSSANWTFHYFDQSSISAITSSLAPEAGTTTAVTELRDIIGFTEKLWAMKLRIATNTSTENAGIKRIIIYYDFVE